VEKPKPRLVLIGPFPEPAGGVSIHLARLASGLETRGYTVRRIDESPMRKRQVFNLRSLNLWAYLRTVLSCDVAHVQSCVTSLRCFHLFFCWLLRLKVVVTVHTLRLSGWKLWVNRLFLRFADEIVLVDPNTDRVLALGKSRVLPAFLPPVGPSSPLPMEVQRFIARQRAQGRSLLCANASKLIAHDGHDLYGLDLCVDLVHSLIRDYGIPMSFVYIVASDASGNALYERALHRIRELSLEDHFLLFNGTVDFAAVIRLSDVVLRPTNTDADALTVREAIYMGKPVIASDVIGRPPGTILFRNRSLPSLIEKTVEVLQRRRTGTPICQEIDYLDPYVKLYQCR